MKQNIFKSLLFSVVCGFYAFSAPAAVSLFSDYGQIQNVQHYSSNPFWSPTAPYNQRLPQPVYATGADLNADDCIKVVQSLVSVQCMARDNCKNTDVSDIRPTIMVQLSNLPGANYVSACSGYIDGIFETYQKQYGNSLPNRAVAFPDATTQNPTVNDSNGIQFENPYKQQPTKWQIEQKERSDELQRLQSQNGEGDEHLTKTNFPATYADLSFSARMENDCAGLEPYKDASAYRTLDVKSESEWCKEHPNNKGCDKSAQHPSKQEESTPGEESKENNEDQEQQNPKDSDPNMLYARIHKRGSSSNRTGKTGNSGRGCYAICGTNPLDDDLNTKVFSTFKDGSKYCADKDQEGLLVKSAAGGTPLQMTVEEYKTIKEKIQNEVADKDKCDWHGRDYIMEIGHIDSNGFSADYETIILDD